MNPLAPPVSPEAHTSDGGSGARTVSLLVIRGAAAAFVVTALAAQIVPASIEVLGGGLAASSALKLGWLYELAFHRVAIDVSGSGAVTGRLSVAFLSGTGLVLWLLFLAGRAAAGRAGPSTRVRVLAGAMVGPVYALPIVVITSLVRLRIDPPGSLLPVGLHGVVWQAFVLPALLGMVAGGAGGVMASVAPASRTRAWLVGGWRALLGALGLAVVAVLLLAALRPQGTATYVRALSSNGPRAAMFFLGHHGLLLPNQSFLVLAPSMGGCVELAGSDVTVPLLCPGRLPALGPADLVEDIARADGSFTEGTLDGRPMPFGYWGFLLVPAVATFTAGRSVGRGRRRTGRGEALICGGGAGVVFAILVGVGTWMASASLVTHPAGGTPGFSLTLGSRPLPTALLALAWGVVAGALGAWSSSPQEEGTPVPVEPDAPVPPNPTSV